VETPYTEEIDVIAESTAFNFARWDCVERPQHWHLSVKLRSVTDSSHYRPSRMIEGHWT